jgi:uncharacterized membrane protein YtjA (UPF0391 family)
MAPRHDAKVRRCVTGFSHPVGTSPTSASELSDWLAPEELAIFETGATLPKAAAARTGAADSTARATARSFLSLRRAIMLKLAIVFFVISLIAGFFGFSGISAGAAKISKWLFFIALAIFVILLVLALLAGQVLF